MFLSLVDSFLLSGCRSLLVVENHRTLFAGDNVGAVFNRLAVCITTGPVGTHTSRGHSQLQQVAFVLTDDDRLHNILRENHFALVIVFQQMVDGLIQIQLFQAWHQLVGKNHNLHHAGFIVGQSQAGDGNHQFALCQLQLLPQKGLCFVDFAV